MKKFFGLLTMLAVMLPSCSANSNSANDADSGEDGAETYEVATADVWTQRGSNRIYGKLYTPQGKTGRLPLVIFSHGFGGSHNDLSAYAERMAQMGYLAYTFDFCGGSNSSRSDGSTTEMSVLTERSDLEAIIDYFKARSDVDTMQITLAGASQGGFVSALTAADRPTEIHSLVLFYPALCIVDDAHSRWSSYESITSSNLWGMRLGAIYYQDAWNIDVYTEIAKYTGPVLLVHGTADNIVNISYADHAAQTYSDVEYHQIQGAGHGFGGTNRTTSINYMASFMNAHAYSSNKSDSNDNLISVTVGGKTFTATLADNETANAFKALLPLTLNMSELNGNEKYHYLSNSLPTNQSNPGTIHAGDIMLYGSSCVVLFYKTFNTSYRYTTIGHIDDPAGLANAVGSGNTTVTFSSQQLTGIHNVRVATDTDAATDADVVTGSDKGVATGSDNDVWYNLHGARVANPTSGIFIHNGKKVKI